MKHIKTLSSLILATTITGCAMFQDNKEEVFVNDFPTQDRVDYVLACIAKHGGLTYINQYKCSCKADKLAEKISFKEYDAAKTFSFLRRTPGENGAIFRDPKQSKDLRAKLQAAEQYAEESCFAK